MLKKVEFAAADAVVLVVQVIVNNKKSYIIESMSIGESKEMYLETIHVLSKKGNVRAIDIVHEMNFSRPTVSIAIHNLEKENYVKIDSDGNISLEQKGLEIAQSIYERHTVLSEMLIRLGVPEEIATEDACKIEHDLSPVTFECIKKHFTQATHQTSQ